MPTQDGGRKNANGRKRTRRWPWVLIGGIVVLIAVSLVLAPVVLSSDGFRRMIQAKISESMGGTADIGNLSVGWRKGVQVSNFRFHEPSGWAAVTIDEIDAQPRLGSLLGGSLSLGRTVIDRPTIEIDLRKRPIPNSSQADDSRASVSPAAGLALLTDMTINDASFRVTDTAGNVARVAQLNSTLNLRLPGQTSRFEATMAVGETDDDAGRVRAAGVVTPPKAAGGWTLKGTTGEVEIEVNDLKLDSLAPIFELVGVDLHTRGRISADISTTVQDGALAALTATVTGRDVGISGAPLKGDRLQTSELAAQVELTRQDQAIRVERLTGHTDWANVTAAGTIPLTAASLTDLLKSDATYSLKGQFDCNLAALLSQMPGTFGLREGMQVTAGRADGSVDTTTEAGRVTMVAQTTITDLAATLDDRPLTLSEPVVASLRLSADDRSARLDAMELTAAFAQVTASGDFNDITYDAKADLAGLQSELGQFADLGPYQMAGQLTSQGQIAIQDELTGIAGTASVRQLVLATADGKSVAEPAADVAFVFDMDSPKQALALHRLDAQGSFGHIAVQDAAIPLDETSPVAMNVGISARALDLERITPYAVLFASLPPNIHLHGIAEATLIVMGPQGKYRIRTDDTQIRDFVLATNDHEPFEQEQVAIVFDVLVEPEAQTLNVETFQLDSPQIKIRKGQLKQTRHGDRVEVEGTMEGECDWAAVGQVAAGVLPEGLELSGRRAISLDFASVYPTDDPNGLLANLDGSARTGFDRALYKGLDIGSTDVQVRVKKGFMNIEPFSTTINNGQLNFAGQIDFNEKDRLLRTPEPMMLAKGIELNTEMTGTLLQYVNPLFADVTDISGIASFECRTLAIPLTEGLERKAEVSGTLSADNVLVEASGLLNEILKATTGQTLRGQRLTVRPTNIVLRDGIVRYDNMQIDVGDNPINFAGAIGLDGHLDMTVTLPWTLKGRTARVDKEDRAGPRIAIPLTGTIGNPQLDLGRLLQEQLFRGLGELFG